jgi:histidine triad (HIT) family protein
MTDCLFCKIVRREIPASVVFETDNCLAFRDIAPKSPTHVLVIPKVHYQSLNEVSSPQVLGELAMTAQWVAQQEGIAGSGYRLVINTGSDGGQTVGHLHLHVLGGRAHAWPPG